MRRATVLLIALLLLVGAAALAGCGGGEDASPTAETVVGEVPPGGGEETETEAGSGAVEGDPAAGEVLFASAGCGSCHTLADAGASGNIGPNLDEAQPDAELVVDRVTNGAGAMPPFSSQLSEQEIADVAAYVVQATGG